jgi:hypothetical protein
MRCLVSFDAERVKQGTYLRVQLDFALKLEKQVRLRCFAIKRDAGAGSEFLRHCFAKLAQLDQRGIRVAGKDLLSRMAKLCEQWRVLCQEPEVAGIVHDNGLLVFLLETLTDGAEY